jgi:hypothetical protein
MMAIDTPRGSLSDGIYAISSPHIDCGSLLDLGTQVEFPLGLYLKVIGIQMSPNVCSRPEIRPFILDWQPVLDVQRG